jgi:hypothetical protein
MRNCFLDRFIDEDLVSGWRMYERLSLQNQRVPEGVCNSVQVSAAISEGQAGGRRQVKE